MKKTLILFFGIAFLLCCTTVPPGNGPDVTVATPPPLKVAMDEPTPVPDHAEDPEAVEPEVKDLSSNERADLMYAFLKASLLEKEERYGEAGDAYQEVMDIAPRSAFTQAMAGKVYLASGEIDKAVDYATKALQIEPEEVEAHRVMARSLAVQGKFDEAIEHFKAIVNLQANPAEALEDLALIYSQRRQHEEAIDVYRRLMNLDPGQAVIYRYRIANTLFQIQRYEEALEEYKKLRESLSNYFDIEFRIASLHEILGENEQAVEAYEAAMRATDSQAEELRIRRRLGKLFRSESKFSDALAQYEAINELEPNNPETRKMLALLYVEKGDYQSAYPHIKTLIAHSHPEFRNYMLLRETLVQLNRDEEAYKSFLAGFERAVKERETESVLAFLWELTRENTLAELQNHDLIERLREIVIVEEPLEHHPRFLMAEARIALWFEQTEQVQTALRKIISGLSNATVEIEEDWVEEWCFEVRGWYQVRQAFVQNNLALDLTEAINRSLERFSYETQLMRTLGMVYIDLRKWNQAETLLTQARSAMQPSGSAYEEVLFQLANVYEKMKRLVDVEEVMTEAMELDPDNAQAYNFLGYTWVDHNVNLNEALSLIEKAVKLSPENGNILDSLGWAYYRMGRTNEAIRYLEQAAEKEKNHPVILDHLGDAYSRIGNKALQYWRDALRFGPEHPYEFTREFRDGIENKIQKMETSQYP